MPAAKKDQTARPSVDWEGIEREYRGGQLSVAEIGRQFGVSHTAIQKKAKKNKWNRDLSEKVRSEIAARLVAEGLQQPREVATVDDMATRGLNLILGHQSHIGRNIGAVSKLIEELHEASDNYDEIIEEIEEETRDDKNGKRRARMLAAVSLPSRANVAATLANALQKLIPLERQAFAIDKDHGPIGGDDTPAKAELTDESIAKLGRLLE